MSKIAELEDIRDQAMRIMGRVLDELDPLEPDARHRRERLEWSATILRTRMNSLINTLMEDREDEQDHDHAGSID